MGFGVWGLGALGVLGVLGVAVLNFLDLRGLRGLRGLGVLGVLGVLGPLKPSEKRGDASCPKGAHLLGDSGYLVIHCKCRYSPHISPFSTPNRLCVCVCVLEFRIKVQQPMLMQLRGFRV